MSGNSSYYLKKTASTKSNTSNSPYSYFCIPCVAIGSAGASVRLPPMSRHRLNGYLAQRVPSLFLASSFRMR